MTPLLILGDLLLCIPIDEPLDRPPGVNPAPNSEADPVEAVPRLSAGPPISRSLSFSLSRSFPLAPNHPNFQPEPDPELVLVGTLRYLSPVPIVGEVTEVDPCDSVLSFEEPKNRFNDKKLPLDDIPPPPPASCCTLGEGSKTIVGELDNFLSTPFSFFLPRMCWSIVDITGEVGEYADSTGDEIGGEFERSIGVERGDREVLFLRNIVEDAYLFVVSIRGLLG